VLISFAVLSLAVLPFAGSLVAQGRGPESLQPDPTAVFISIVLRHDAPIARGNILILPSASGHTTFSQPTSGGSSGSTTAVSTSANSLKVSGSAYTSGPTMTPTTTQPEAEEEIAADPADSFGRNLVSAISDFSQPTGFNFTKWALSTNGGSSWSENFVPYNTSTGLLETSDGQSWDANSDPVLAFDRSGNVYLSDLYITLDSQGRITSEGLYVSADTFNNLQSSNFAHAYPVRVNLNNGKTFSIEDKPWLTADNSSTPTAGYVYASWSHFTGCQNKFSVFVGYYLTCSSDAIYVAYSKNHGQTWSTPVVINPSGQNGAVQGSQITVGPNGRVYVVYEFMGSSNQRRQYLSEGTWSSGRLSFSVPFAATPVFSELTFSGCSTCSAGYRVNSFPNIAVSPATSSNPSGNVYIEYGGQANTTSTAQVYFVACTNNCSSSTAFSAPSIVNDNLAGDHFFPAIAVDPSGVVHSSWFDTRNNSSNPDYLDIYAAYLSYDSTTNSFTISPNARVTPISMDASELDGFGDTNFIGDYAGIAATAATPATAHPVWTNASGVLGILLNGSLQTSTLTLPAGVP
jgi:hypothetical protein